MCLGARRGNLVIYFQSRWRIPKWQVSQLFIRNSAFWEDIFGNFNSLERFFGNITIQN